MRIALVLIALVAGAAAAYFAWDRGAADALTLVSAAVAVFALGFARVSGGGRSAPSSTPQSVVSPRAVRSELSSLAGNLEALAESRESDQQALNSGKAQVAAYLTSPGRNQIAAIKAIRQATNLGLKEAKDITDAAKTGQRTLIAASMSLAAARRLARDIEAAGGRVTFE